MKLRNLSYMNIITYSRPSDQCGDFPAGKLGNQAGGFPFEALGHKWRSSEHLYLLGYWSGPEEANIAIQRDVLSAPSGYAAKRFNVIHPCLFYLVYHLLSLPTLGIAD